MYGERMELRARRVVLVNTLRATPTEQTQADECTICGYILPRTFLLGTNVFCFSPDEELVPTQWHSRRNSEEMKCGFAEKC